MLWKRAGSIVALAGLAASLAASLTAFAHDEGERADHSGGISAAGKFHLDTRGFPASPLSHEDFQNDPEHFQFVVISDRTGGHRTPVFRQAIQKINLLQPEFVVSVGDMVEGYTTDKAVLEKQWQEIGGMIDTLEAPYLYTPGNHDYSNDVMADIWREKYGADYYHMVYKDVLFLVLNTEAALQGVRFPQLDDAQFAYAEKVLQDNPGVKWTMVFMHQPLWKFENTNNWDKLQAQLSQRKYTAIAGHLHSYDYSTAEAGQELLTLGSTGGVSLLRGTTHGEFDHVTWITMSDQGPVIANLELDGILDKYITDPAFDHVFDHNTVFQYGNWFRSGDMLAAEREHHYDFKVFNPFDQPLNYSIDFKANLNILLNQTEYAGQLAAGESATHELTMKIVGTQDFDALKPLEINAHAAYDINPLKKTEWGEVVRISPVPRHPVSRSPVALAFDGRLDEWDSLRYGFGPAEGQDGAARFDVRYDEEFLYVGYRVSDDEVTEVAPQGFDGTADLVYFMVDARPSELSGMQLGSTKAMKKGEWIFLAVAPHAEEGQIAYADLMPKGFAGKAKRTQTGFTAELRVPVAYLNHVYGSEWQDFRINASYLDADPQGSKIRNYDWQPKWDRNVVGTGLFFRAEE